MKLTVPVAYNISFSRSLKGEETYWFYHGRLTLQPPVCLPVLKSYPLYYLKTIWIFLWNIIKKYYVISERAQSPNRNSSNLRTVDYFVSAI